jgi:hypothetical protein
VKMLVYCRRWRSIALRRRKRNSFLLYSSEQA